VRAGLALVETLRDALPALRFEMNHGGGNFKAQFRRADRSGASLALILGDNELERGVASLKPLRQEAEQMECALAELPARIPALLKTLNG
jgi:histidyl-tRNA synthetase